MQDIANTYVQAQSPASDDVPDQSPDLTVAYVVIELDSLWANTAKALFVSVALGASDGSGTRVEMTKRPSPQGLAAALELARELERRWWKRRSLLKALRQVGATNCGQVQIATNVPAVAFNHLHLFRNFYAHRGIESREKLEVPLRSLRVPTQYSATRALLTHYRKSGSPRHQPILLDLLDEVRATIELLV
ncbi:MAG: hypothetical protein F4180_07340 [Chloroflexi bacterium]|nr:hypothetical protein [Chloroflexota bacterium]